MFVLFLFIMSISLAAVAGAFSIIGLMAIYPASALGVLIGAIVIEICKLFTISFLYQYYDVIKFGKKLIAVIFIVISMAITSMGVYGYLTKGYIQQIAPMGNVELQIATIDGNISRYEFDIEQAMSQLKIIDDTTRKYIELGAVSRSVAVESDREEKRKALNSIINESQNKIFELRQEKTQLSLELKKIEAEVGPIQYVADLFMGDVENSRDIALKWFSIIMVLAIDPFAVVLLVFANTAYKFRNDPRLNREFGGIFDKKENNDNIDSRVVEDFLDKNKKDDSEMLKNIVDFLNKKEKEETDISKQYQSHDNSDLVELLKQATKTLKEEKVDSPSINDDIQKKQEEEVEDKTENKINKNNQRNGWL